MRILTREEVELGKNEIIDAMRRGLIFIYPTDTIYGLGCNATIPESVKKIRDLKERVANPFSVVAPSIEWIKENCIVSREPEMWENKLPGPCTLIFEIKSKKCVAPETNNGMKTLGVRIPKHWTTKIIQEAGVPFITTSVNKSGEDYMTSLENLDPDIKGSVDFIIYEGAKEGKPSTIVDLTGRTKFIER